MAQEKKLIKKTLGIQEIFPLMIRCECGHLLMKIEEFKGQIVQDTKCTSCKSIVRVIVINKIAS